MVVLGIKTVMLEKKTPTVEEYEKYLETAADQFRIM
jgi:hypothetical protein